MTSFSDDLRIGSVTADDIRAELGVDKLQCGECGEDLLEDEVYIDRADGELFCECCKNGLDERIPDEANAPASAALLRFASETTIALEPLESEEVTAAAIRSYKSNPNRGNDFWAEEGKDPRFLERITVNYIKHELTPYDAMLDYVSDQPGAGEAKAIIYERIYDAIGDACPELGSECDRQRDEKLQWLD